MKCSGKLSLMIILKVTKNRGFTLSSQDTFYEKRQGGQIDPPSCFRAKSNPQNYWKPKAFTGKQTSVCLSDSFPNNSTVNLGSILDF